MTGRSGLRDRQARDPGSLDDEDASPSSNEASESPDGRPGRPTGLAAVVSTDIECLAGFALADGIAEIEQRRWERDRSARSSSPLPSSSGSHVNHVGPRARSPTLWRTGRGRRKELIAAVGKSIGLADLDKRPDLGQGKGAPDGADLAPVADQDDAKRGARLEAVAGQCPVALLEDVERDDDAGAQHRVQWEERDLHRLVCALYGSKRRPMPLRRV